MVTDELTTNLDNISDTIMFKSEDTPSNAYTKLTQAVYDAKGYDSVSMIDTENLPNDTVIGTATYDTSEEKVTDLQLKQWVLDDYGY